MNKMADLRNKYMLEIKYRAPKCTSDRQKRNLEAKKDKLKAQFSKQAELYKAELEK